MEVVLILRVFQQVLRLEYLLFYQVGLVINQQPQLQQHNLVMFLVMLQLFQQLEQLAVELQAAFHILLLLQVTSFAAPVSEISFSAIAD